MLSGIHFANADDLDSFVKNRQQVLNQFEDARQPASPALLQPGRAITAAIAPRQPVSSVQSSDNADELISSAMGLLGVAYRYGGTSALSLIHI